MSKTILLIIGILLLFFLIYSILPTLIIRRCGFRITKKINPNQIALTFDDGPDPHYTERLLDLLKKYQIKATFFVVGSKVEMYPEIIKRMKREGHTIGIHHYHHVSGWLLSPFQLKNQLERTKKAIEECTHENVKFYRPPWGHFNLFSLIISKEYTKIMWSAIFGDWKVKRCKNTLLDELRKTEKGSILLLHDCGETWGADEEAPKFMLEKLEMFLEENKEKGTSFVTLKEMDG
ncbi:polysaccharide deacetylase family protein [Cytobacillus sp. Hz8]|uniref:polysaccharide deacetylase family protein n=1 Tax=Cytobacillus sp. Hz8 TaxID=3347168 RepID=UPI0035D963C9